MNYTLILMMAGLFAVMYFLMFRPQKKQQQQRANMLKEMQKGDKVVTIGGLKGTVDEIDNDTREIVIDADGVFLTFDLGAIRTTTKATATDTSAPAATETKAAEKVEEPKEEEKEAKTETEAKAEK
ncbi:preprotein translocase subunit YajC [Lactobacillus sp. YT155]|uniref:preprotein translocase subunit YajC n=1 Tax=Lactobacillus sp. YT155 TaxID=3060955 RepID=UPI00266046E1|nr:preprotein translocase subunit YajC [Lactobacillus sp. YT155]MDO1605899.1 preprotein translocase subunit YajC [Lactobacillus sp. YT155]